MKTSRGFAQADLFVSRDGRAVIKTWRLRPSWERVTVCKWLARRETRALQKLAGFEGVPQLLASPDALTIMMTRLEGRNLPPRKAGALPPEYFSRLWEMISEMHRRGMNHGDIRRKNLLCAAADASRPQIVDFTQTICFDRVDGFFARHVLKSALRVDRIKFLELKADYSPGSLSESDRLEIENAPWTHLFGRFLRSRIYRPLKRLVRGGRHR